MLQWQQRRPIVPDKRCPWVGCTATAAAVAAAAVQAALSLAHPQLRPHPLNLIQTNRPSSAIDVTAGSSNKTHRAPQNCKYLFIRSNLTCCFLGRHPISLSTPPYDISARQHVLRLYSLRLQDTRHLIVLYILLIFSGDRSLSLSKFTGSDRGVERARNCKLC